MASALRRTIGVLRAVPETVTAIARQIPRRRLVFAAIGIVILVAVTLLVPLPTALELRDWARSLGPWFPLAFLAAHSLATVLPFPRTAFTLAAGLLFGSALGIALALTASTISAVLAVVLVRAFGWQLSGLVSHPRIDAVDAHLRRRGWLAVLSLRLIPAVPFSVINYAAGASAVRLRPYAAATVLGLFPGTSAVVILGDALTGSVNPLLVLFSLCTAGVGVAGLAFELRSHRRKVAAQEPESVQPAGLSG
ncbi:TVP38/TMEM64 family protein [[Mycobacterium] burgundiense]|uniref:TVP38/TMEM64 family protein n=1 Tax=[Mycobacterium] burgundiense TaxID=3064286 RepID=UPI0035A19841